MSIKQNIVKIGILIAFVLIVIFISLIILLDKNTPKGNRYLIPVGYEGNLTINYSVPNAPVLKIEDGYRLIKFPISGTVNTSTKGLTGKHKDYFYRYNNGAIISMNIEKELGGGYTVWNQKNPSNQITFIFWVKSDTKD